MEIISNVGEPKEMRLHPVETREEMFLVAGLAKDIWEKHYIPIIGKEQVAYMLQTLQSDAAIARSIQLYGNLYYLLYWKKIPVGYLAIKENREDSSLFLSKLYLKEETRGKGIASGTMKILFQYAKLQGFKKIWLTCNIYNKETIEVYKHFGFEIVDAEQNDIGSGYIMDDYIMEIIID